MFLLFKLITLPARIFLVWRVAKMVFNSLSSLVVSALKDDRLFLGATSYFLLCLFISHKQYLPVDKSGRTVPLPEKTTVNIVSAFDGSLKIDYLGQIFNLKFIAEGRTSATTPIDKHPWKDILVYYLHFSQIDTQYVCRAARDETTVLPQPAA